MHRLSLPIYLASLSLLLSLSLLAITILGIKVPTALSASALAPGPRMFSPLTLAASRPGAATTPATLLPGDPWRKGNGACLGLRCPYPYAARVDVGSFRCQCELQPEQDVLMEQPSQVAKVAHQWDYYRVPKSGSTAVEAILRACPDVRYHDHGDGCENLDVCDGQASTGPSFVVLRRPSDRFKAQFDHLHRKLPTWAEQHIPTEKRLAGLLKEAFAGCAQHGERAAACRVERVNARVARLVTGGMDWQHRVILYPTQFFTRPGTRLICYDKVELSQRFAHFMSSTFKSCPVQASDVPRLNAANESEFSDDSAAVSDRDLYDDDIYPGDVDMWVRQCAEQLARASERRGADAPRPAANALDLEALSNRTVRLGAALVAGASVPDATVRHPQSLVAPEEIVCGDGCTLRSVCLPEPCYEGRECETRSVTCDDAECPGTAACAACTPDRCSRMCANGQDVCQDRVGQLVSEPEQSSDDVVQTDLRGQTPGEWPLPGTLDERGTLKVADNQCLSVQEGTSNEWCQATCNPPMQHLCNTTCSPPDCPTPTFCACGVFNINATARAEQEEQAKQQAQQRTADLYESACDWDADACIQSGPTLPGSTFASQDCRTCTMHVKLCQMTPRLDADNKVLDLSVDDCIDEIANKTATKACGGCATQESRRAYRVREGMENPP